MHTVNGKQRYFSEFGKRKLLWWISLFFFLVFAADTLAAPIVAKKNTAYTILFGMVDSADTALLKSCTITDDCDSYVASTDTWSAQAITDTATQSGTTGMYAIDLTAAEMNHDYISCKFTCTGALANMITITTTAVDVDDLVRSTTPANTLDVHVDGDVESNVVKLSSSATSLANFKSMFDGTGYSHAKAPATQEDLGAPVGASISADIADVPTVSEFNARTQPTADYFDWTTDDVANVATIASMAPPTNWDDLDIEVTTGRVDSRYLNGVAAATAIFNAANSSIENYNLDHLLAASVTGTDVVDDSVVAFLVDDAVTADWDNYDNTASSLSALATASAPSAAAIADAVWLETLADHSGTGGSTAEALANASAAGDPWAVNIPASYTGVQAGKVVGDALTGHIAQTGDTYAALPTNFSDLAITLGGGKVDSYLLAGVDPATLILSMLQTYNLDHIAFSAAPGAPVADSYLDLLADDGTATYDRTTDSLQALADGGIAGPTTGAIADAVWDEIITTHAVEGSYGKRQYDETWPHGVAFYWDPTSGNDSNTGLSEAQAKLTWASVLGLVTAGRGDTIVMIEGSLSAEEIDLSKNDMTLSCVHPRECEVDGNGTPVNEVQTLTTTGTASGGTFTLTGDDVLEVEQTTSALAWNASMATINTELDTVYGASRIVASGTVDVLVLTFSGQGMAGYDKDAFTMDVTSLTGVSASTPVETTKGSGTVSITMSADRVALDGVRWEATDTGGNNTGVLISGDDAVVTRCIAENTADEAITITGNRAYIHHNVFHEFSTVVLDDKPCILVNGTAALQGTRITDNQFSFYDGTDGDVISLIGANLTDTEISRNAFLRVADGLAITESTDSGYTLMWDNAQAGTDGFLAQGFGSVKHSNDSHSSPGDEMNLTSAAVDAVWDEPLTGHTTASTYGKSVTDIETDVTQVFSDSAAILVDTNEMQGKLPTGTISNFDESADDVNVTVAAGDLIADEVWDELSAGHVTSSSFAADLSGMSTTIDSISGVVSHASYGNEKLVRASDPATAIDTSDVTGRVFCDVVRIDNSVSAAENLSDMLNNNPGTTLRLDRLNIISAGSGDAVTIAGGTGVLDMGVKITGNSSTGAGVFVESIGNGAVYLNGVTGADAMSLVSASSSGVPLHIKGPSDGPGVLIDPVGTGIASGVEFDSSSVSGAMFDMTGAGGGDFLTGGVIDVAVSSVTGAVGSVTAAVETDAASRTASKADVSNLDVAVSSRSSHAAADVWTSGTRTLSAWSGIVDDVWDELWGSHTTAGTTGRQIGTIFNLVYADTDEIQSVLPLGAERMASAVSVETELLTYDAAVPGDQMDLINVPNATAVTAIQSGLSTFSSGDAVTLSNNAITANSIATAAITTAKIAAPNDLKADISTLSTFDETTDGVLLADGAHGGSAAVLTLERVAVASTTLNTSAVTLTGDGTGAGLSVIGGATGVGLLATGGGSGGHGVSLVGTTTGDGLHVAGGASGDGLDAVGGVGGVDVRGDITGGLTGNVTGSVSGGVGSITGTVTTDAASRTAAKADVSALATAASLTTVEGKVDAVQAKTDDLTFTSANTIDARVNFVGATPVTSPVDVKADVSNLDATVSSRSSHSAADITGGVTIASLQGIDGDTLETLSDQADTLSTFDPTTDEVALVTVVTDVTNSGALVSGLIQASTATSVTLDGSASSTSHLYVGSGFIVTTGAGKGQSRLITAYNGSTRVATTDPFFIVQPSLNDGYSIVENPVVFLESSTSSNISNTNTNVGLIFADTNDIQLTLVDVVADTNELQVDDIPGVLSTSFGALHNIEATDVWNNTINPSRSVTGGTINNNTSERGTDNAAQSGAIMALTAQATANVRVDLARTTDVTSLNDVSTTDLLNAATNALNTYAPPTKAEMDSAHALLSTHDADAVVTALMTYTLDSLSYEDTIELVRAVLGGSTTSPAANQISFKRADGTVIATITYTAAGVRSTVVTP